MKLPVVNTPEYETTLKTVGVVKYRPFLVKEQKVLLMAAQSKDNKTIMDALRNCVQSCAPGVDVSKLPHYDLAYLFLKIRAKSVGEVVQLKFDCSCGEEVRFQVNVDEIEIEGEEADATVQLTDTIGVKLRSPSIEEGEFMIALGDPQNQINMIASCIDCVYSDDQIIDGDDVSMEDKIVFLENLTDKQLVQLISYFEQQPVLVYRGAHKCNACGKESDIILNNAVDFF